MIMSSRSIIDDDAFETNSAFLQYNNLVNGNVAGPALSMYVRVRYLPFRASSEMERAQWLEMISLWKCNSWPCQTIAENHFQGAQRDRGGAGDREMIPIDCQGEIIGPEERSILI